MRIWNMCCATILTLYIFIQILVIKYWVYRIGNKYVKICADSTEYNALRMLQINQTCSCHHKRNHFPIVLFRLNLFPYAMILCVNDVGVSLNQRPMKRAPVDLVSQCNCIFNTMQRAGVKHDDILAQNVCIDKQGTISLIDFELILTDYNTVPFNTRTRSNDVNRTRDVNRLIAICKQNLQPKTERYV